MPALSLAGRTAFITGGSRGIGLEIGKSLAARGANVVIAAKTATPHPKLPGTIFTACDEISSAAQASGSSAVAHPVQLDIRDATAVEKAIDDVAAKFGGLDIVVNNASAINMAPTVKASVKSYDLMNGINARGTWLVSRFALPHLLESAGKGNNPHVLTLSPPLNFNSLSTTPGPGGKEAAIFPHQFAQTAAAYTIAKYGMSLLTLGLSAETLGKVGVNSLWPYTLIATSAMKIVSKDAEVEERRWRSPTIVAEAAARVVEENAATFSGQFLVDELYLREKGFGLEDIKKFNVDETTELENLAEDLYISQELRDAIRASRK
ncbi:Short-chain dehydrogenase/reductase SDR [Kalmanozyma brasiliensis GHG001]|uniref:Gluconate 5-dehydrogenase n=1 Tax=Kalmanozyma brasiliensis (strain GHG001) TaxID=1365824 RepID=V5EQR0_KALBG|nr:Short-chain dehydrogenase/reductase SDR [Kalmanozyma brasiliensis GHG001]EST05278.1 Short-chain dehydrogenase/reductase SDR [Kalmanozyma brasiliensis GHG001]